MGISMLKGYQWFNDSGYFTRGFFTLGYFTVGNLILGNFTMAIIFTDSALWAGLV